MLDIITEQELAENGVVSAPDKLTGDPEENKKVFDRLITAVLAPHINRVVRACNELETALRDHIDIDPTSVRDNNVSVTEEVVAALGLEGINPTVKDALLAQDENVGELDTVLRGLIGERALIVTGSYIGTGETTKTLTFEFEPKLLFVAPESRESSTGSPNLIAINGVTSTRSHIGGSGNNADYTTDLVWDNKDVTLSNVLNAKGALNTNGTVYHYAAIGMRGALTK